MKDARQRNGLEYKTGGKRRRVAGTVSGVCSLLILVFWSSSSSSSSTAFVVKPGVSLARTRHSPIPPPSLHEAPRGIAVGFHKTVPQSPRHSKLHMASGVAAGVAAITGAISGGMFAGGLHAIAGPDHLAALIPRCCGQRWYKAGWVGALWGMGHGMSAFLVGVVAVAVKNGAAANWQSCRGLLRGASSAMELAVGLSLVVIGLLGMKEAREWKEEMEMVTPQSLSAAAAESGVKKNTQKRAVIFNGLLHGFSWDGAPSLAPALAVATWRASVTFLLSYALGTVAVMTIATTMIGEGTVQAGQMLDRPDVPQKISMFSSAFAIAIGALWCALALK